MAGKILIAGKDPAKLNVNMPSSDFFDKKSVKMVQTTDIVTAEPFIGLYKIKEEVLGAIVENMKDQGFDDNQPVIIWKERNILIDGHTRLKASTLVGIKSIPAFYASFKTEDEALEYMHRIQFNRRNINDADLIRLIKEALPKYEKKYGEGSKAEFLAKRFIGLSEGKAKQSLVVAEKATEEDVAAIEEGLTSIYQIYMKLNKEKKEPKEKVSANFFEDDGEKRIIRTDDNGVFYFRDYEKMKELKAFVLPVFMNSPRVRERILQVIEEELGGVR